MPDLSSFEVFLAVAETGSLGEAARELGLTQQTVSRRLALMEERTGVVLATRTTRGTELTLSGHEVFKCAQRLLEVARDIDAGLNKFADKHHHTLKVIASPTITEFLMPSWILSFERNSTGDSGPRPKVELGTGTSAEVITAVREFEADLGFVETPDIPIGLGYRVVGHDELVVVVHPNHPWAQRKRGVRAVELASTALVTREAGAGLRRSLTIALHEALGDEMNQAPASLELPSAGAVRTAVLAGAGPAVMSRLCARDDLTTGRLCEVLVPELQLNRQLCAIWRGGRTPPAGGVRLLLNHIERYSGRPDS